MISSRFNPFLLSVLLLAALAPGLGAQQMAAPGDERGDPILGESADRHAQVKFVEGSVLIHKGDTDETLTRGLPVAEGDVLESRGRGVLQLGDGSAVAFGPGSRFRVAALFSAQDQVQRVLLVLDQGELRVRRGAFSEAVLRVDTPSGSGTLGGPDSPDATFLASTERLGLRTVFAVHDGQGTFSNGRGQTRLPAGQRLTVYGNLDGLDRVADFNAYALDEFDQWADALVKGRPGPSAGKVPPEIRAYTDALDTTGTWSYVDESDGYCWSPSGLSDDWRPYCDGRWGAYDGGLTWVGDEPWAFLTFHFGRWGWTPWLGWYWIPGSTYSPAWVAWSCSDLYFGWAPLGYTNRPCRWGYGAWAGGPCWNVVNLGYAALPELRRRLYSDPAVLRSFASARPWSGGRMMVTAAEFREPGGLQQVLAQPALVLRRVAGYARATEAATGHPLARTAAKLPFRRQERPETPAPPRGPTANLTDLVPLRTERPQEEAPGRAQGPEREAGTRELAGQGEPFHGSSVTTRVQEHPSRVQRREAPEPKEPAPRDKK